MKLFVVFTTHSFSTEVEARVYTNRKAAVASLNKRTENIVRELGDGRLKVKKVVDTEMNPTPCATISVRYPEDGFKDEDIISYTMTDVTIPDPSNDAMERAKAALARNGVRNPSKAETALLAVGSALLDIVTDD